MLKKIKYVLVLSSIFLSACPFNNGQVKPTPTPPVSSIDPVIITPVNIISDSFYKVEFGPGSKGVSNLGPGSKGVSNLGPGSKGVNEFGPGSKGVSNLKFSINFDSTLIRSDISSFSTKSTPVYVNDLILTLEKDDVKIADINVIPKASKVEFTIDTNIKPDIYNLKAYVKNNSEPLYMYSKVELKSNLEVKVVLYSKDQTRENLDIAIRTKSIPAPETTEAVDNVNN